MSKQQITALQQLADNFRVIGKVQYEQNANGEEKITENGFADFNDKAKPMNSQTISGIGSITKQFTAATLIKLWDEDLTKNKNSDKNFGAEIFPEGIDTKLAKFMPDLENKFTQCAELFTKIKADEHYADITLRDLLNHTHGLGGRNEQKGVELVKNTGDRPLELFEIANITEKNTTNPRRGLDEHGKHKYSNFGFDLAAMIIEAITQKPFDQVVRDKVLTPNGLFLTHPQSDHVELYKANSNLARGYFLDSALHPSCLSADRLNEAGEVILENSVELNFNTKSNTRAAGGFKSSVGDLAKFAKAYMGGEMFENAEAKNTVTNYQQGANMPKLNEKGEEVAGKNFYHLAIKLTPNGNVGHAGDDLDFVSDLRFNPKTNEIKAELLVVENLTTHVCSRVFGATNAEDQKSLENLRNSFFERLRESDYPKVGSPENDKIMSDVLNDKSNAKGVEALNKYSNLLEEIQVIEPQNLVQNREEIISNLIAQRQQKPSTTVSGALANKLENNQEIFKS